MATRTNLEAQGAQRYWPALFGAEFRRDRAGPGLNRLLNYGYAVLRAATSRALVCAGLLPGLGLFHANRGDAFALASDLMEPYRPFVDGIVWELAQAGLGEATLDRELKAQLLGVLNLAVGIEGRAMPLGLALGRSASSPRSELRRATGSPETAGERRGASCAGGRRRRTAGWRRRSA
ncbi:MAG: type II CRISPR-associated endonuclease Cas1 [Acetobacteraceae bacterium]|nr:type II CRISPR-associated endonuclease Cas1 [Acetobacteraceae bacterium]